MKKPQFAALFIFLLFVFYSCHREPPELDFPSYEKIVKKFAKKYSLETTEDGYIVFQKCPEGWYVALHPLEKKKIKKRKLYWDAETREFNKIKFDKLDEGEENKEDVLQRFLNEREIFLYNLHPYYGYINYEKDVIDFFTKYKKLNDDQLYSLGRAYDSYGSNLISSHLEAFNDQVKFDLEIKKNAMNKEQLATYKEYKQNAIRTHTKLADRNPEYATLVGSIRTKLANDYMNAFLQLWMFQNENEAQNFIKDMPDLYSKQMLSYARNFLSTCGKNAILFTNGDNDTYPLLYIQASENVRTDVLVINTSLLNLPRYAYRLTSDNIFDCKPVNLSLELNEYNEDKLEAVKIKTGSPGQSYTLKELIHLAANLNTDSKEKDNDTEDSYLPANCYTLMVSDSLDIDACIKSRKLYRGDILFLDILANNIHRPVYFASYYPVSNLGLEKYLNAEGLVYKLVPALQDMDSKQLYKNLMHTYDFSWADKISQHEKRMVTNYRYHFGLLGRRLIQENKPDSARAVLNKCLELFPDNTLYYDWSIVSIIIAFYELEDFEKGDKIANILMKNLENGKHNASEYEVKNGDPTADFDSRKEYLNRLLQYFERSTIETKNKKDIKNLFREF